MMSLLRRQVGASRNSATRALFFSTYKAVVEVDRVKQIITISPPSTHAVLASMVFLHGLGDTCFGWGQAMVDIAERVKGLRIVLPTAGERPVTLNGGYEMPAWYDIKGLSDRADQDCDGIEASRKIVLDLLNKEKRLNKLTASNLVLGGFSQGGAMSLYCGLQYDDNADDEKGEGGVNNKEGLGAVLCMSGYLPNASKWKATSISHDTPFAMLHGKNDGVVRLQWAQKSYDRMMSDFNSSSSSSNSSSINSGRKKQPTERLFKVYDGLEHSASDEEMDDVVTFLTNNIAGLGINTK
jgi:predicted esterase